MALFTEITNALETWTRSDLEKLLDWIEDELDERDGEEDGDEDSDEDEYAEEIYDDLMDILDPWQVDHLESVFADGPKHVFWTGEGVPFSLTPLGSGQWQLKAGPADDEMAWDLGDREVRSLCRLLAECGAHT